MTFPPYVADRACDFFHYFTVGKGGPMNLSPQTKDTPVRNSIVSLLFTIGTLLCLLTTVSAGEGPIGSKSYDDYDTPDYCGSSCHTDFYQQWRQAMMSQSYTHHWDEIEYFKLAIPHAEKDPVVAEVKAGCNGCHAPISFLTGDVPPRAPKRAAGLTRVYSATSATQLPVTRETLRSISISFPVPET